VALLDFRKWAKFRELDRKNRALLDEPDASAYAAADKATWLVSRACHCVREGSHKKAADDFRATIRVKPDWGPAYGGLAHVLNIKGDFKAAITLLDNAPAVVQVAGDSIRLPTWEYDFHRAYAYRGLGDSAEARAHARRALDALDSPEWRNMEKQSLRAATLGHHYADMKDLVIETLRAIIDETVR
jgi:tetratricopeptide (TPR) repeat protein